MRRIAFEEIEQACHDAGFFISDACRELGISRRTWYRWKHDGHGPQWAYRLINLLSGDLSHFGWKHWQIRQGTLYNDQLNSRYYQFKPADLLVSVFCSCPGHKQLQRSRGTGSKVTQLNSNENRSPLGKGSGSIRYTAPKVKRN